MQVSQTQQRKGYLDSKTGAYYSIKPVSQLLKNNMNKNDN